MSSHRDLGSSRTPQIPAPQDTIREVLEVIRTDPRADHSLSALSERFFYSRFHFHRLFMAHTGTTPARYIAGVRMRESKRLLINTEYSVMEISAAVGYSSVGTFTTQFSNLVGVPPATYRKLIDTAEPLHLGDLYDTPSGSYGATIDCPSDLTDPITFVGIFRTDLPQGHPVSYSMTHRPEISYAPIDEGTSATMFAVSHEADQSLVEVDLSDSAGTLVAATALGGPDPLAPAQVELRPQSDLDPPIVSSAPLLQLLRQTGRLPRQRSRVVT